MGDDHARTALQLWQHHVVDRLGQNFERIHRIRPGARLLDRRINNPLRERLLAALHDRADQASHDGAAITAIQLLFLMNNATTTGHVVC